MNRTQLKCVLALSLAMGLAGTYGCSNTNSSHNTGGGGGGGGAGSNVASITVNTGPAAGPPTNSPYINGAFTSVTVCAPGTSQCQTIGGILVDTGSPGLRILASALTISLPQQTGTGGEAIAECAQFADGFTWGPVQTADMKIAGEEAKSLPIQVIGSSSFSTIPTSCSSHGTPEDDLAHLGTNGILGVGFLAQDCGDACTVSGSSNAGFYYACPNTGCTITTEPVVNQVQNPVPLFASDNNGVLIQLPSITGPQTSVSGSLIFGIGTRSNNALGNATIYGINPTSGNFTTTFQGTTYVNSAFIDSGSNALFFLDSTTTGLPTCASPMTAFYCPSTTQSFTATNQGIPSGNGTVDFQVGNADTLTANPATAAASQLAGPNPNLIDWGLPFFFGRTVFTAIEGATTPSGTGPFWAY